MKNEANELRNQVKARTKGAVKRKTGNLLRGVKRSKKPYSIDDERKIRVYNTSRHAHLIEYGHKPNSKAFNILSDTKKGFESEFINDANNFVRELIKL